MVLPAGKDPKPGDLLRVTVATEQFAGCPDFVRPKFTHLEFAMWDGGADSFGAGLVVASTKIQLPAPPPAPPKASGAGSPQGGSTGSPAPKPSSSPTGAKA